MQNREPSERIVWIDASLLTQTNIEGGSTDNETRDIAVIACLMSSVFADITDTVEAMPRMA